MKLLYCLYCRHLFNLGASSDRPRVCSCGKVSGSYKEDGDRIWFTGPAVVFGLDNYSFSALIGNSSRIPDNEPTIFKYPLKNGKVEKRDEY